MTEDEILDRIRTVFFGHFGQSCVITLDSGPDDIDGWDSIANVTLLTNIEKEFSLRFSLKQMLEFSTVADIVVAVKLHFQNQV